MCSSDLVVRQVLAESSRYIIMSSLGNIKNALFVSETPELELPVPLASVQESRWGEQWCESAKMAARLKFSFGICLWTWVSGIIWPRIYNTSKNRPKSLWEFDSEEVRKFSQTPHDAFSMPDWCGTNTKHQLKWNTDCIFQSCLPWLYVERDEKKKNTRNICQEDH